MKILYINSYQCRTFGINTQSFNYSQNKVKPLCILASNDSVFFSGEGGNYRAVKAERDKYEKLCSDYGVDNETIKEQAANSDRVKNADSNHRATYKTLEERRLFKDKYFEIIKNAEGKYDAISESDK